jgi:hypothetical protein
VIVEAICVMSIFRQFVFIDFDYLFLFCADVIYMMDEFK